MRRAGHLAVRALACSVLAGALGGGAGASGATAVRIPARVQDGKIALLGRGGYTPRFLAGVNLGATLPGRSPGEVAGDRAVYDRWLREMGDLGVSTVRIYTILRPSFYEALAAYDRAAAHPILLIQGVWIPEERFLATGNAYDPEVTAGFRAELRDAVAVVHGGADLPLRPGHAGGRYRADVSPWLVAWSPGVEWDPFAVAKTDRLNRGRPHYRGRFVTTSSAASPMESWIASNLDYLASLELARGWSRPLTFTNWLTVDPLRHRYEPLAREDMVAVDATHLAATARWPGGFFASYHAYPYYPDFMRRTPAYAGYHRPWDGGIDPYAGYLHALRLHHGRQAVMITEFGVPSSIGVAHHGPLGRDQGGESEQEGARMEARLLDDIRREGYAGGLIFEWADEWFKFTWNTVEYELPGTRRQLWRNPLTNEEHFGVVATEPGSAPVVTLDGSDREWAKNGSQVIAESRGAVREVRAVKDEEYVYLRLRLDAAGSWRRTPVTIGFDTYAGGNRGLPGAKGFDPGAEVAVTVGPGDTAQLREAAWIDPILFQYGLHRHYLRVQASALRPGSGVWVAPEQILDRPLTIPATGERVPVELAPYDRLRFGTTDPAAAGFDDRNLVDGAGPVLELRIPYSYLGFSDPSSLRLLLPRLDGSLTTAAATRVGISIAAGTQRLQTRGYAWEPWNAVRWHERRKAGWAILRAAFARER